jgi:RNA polymerase sigma-70 factor, ECF subfamily
MSMESEMDDLQAIRRLKNGDIGGLEVLIASYQAKAVRTAYLVTRHEPMAEDVVQEAFIRFYERVGYFDETHPFEPYFLRSVVNRALNAVEKEHATTGFDEDLGTPALQALLARAVSVEAQVEYAQLKTEIAGALENLSPRQRAAVVLRYYLEMSEKEMTETLKIAPGTVKWLLNAARGRLRTLLGPERISK